MIDYVEELELENFANGYKDLLKDEWFFKVHWPKDPNMPGMLQIESCTNERNVYFNSSRKYGQGNVSYFCYKSKIY